MSANYSKQVKILDALQSLKRAPDEGEHSLNAYDFIRTRFRLDGRGSHASQNFAGSAGFP